jgi:hypothetical protein
VTPAVWPNPNSFRMMRLADPTPAGAGEGTAWG